MPRLPSSDSIRSGRLVWAGALAVGLCAALGVYGWLWQRDVPLLGVEVSGALMAPPAELEALAALPEPDPATADTAAGTEAFVPLFDLDPVLLADRVRRHPWVEDADVRRWPTGTLELAVTERVPVALAIGRDGRAAYYLDGAGHQMPVPPRPEGTAPVAYDVPLVRGHLPTFRPTLPVEDEPLLALLATLAQLPDTDPAADALVSELRRERDGGFTLLTSPAAGHGPVEVVLGTGGPSGFGEQLARLTAFYAQAVRPQPERRFAQIDLRFHDQIVTREVADGPAPS
jgi:cell division protein FtsQ